ncbi:MAG: hypothetical protein EZS28_042095, partial [Streblomastix strix]
MTMTTDAAPSGWGSTLERELEMITITHGTWNKRQLKCYQATIGKSKLQLKAYEMNLNPTIDLFSQHFNNLLPRFMSTIRGHGEIAIDALNQTWKKELPWIHPPIPLLPAVLKKIREEQIEAMIIAPLWPGQIWYTELVNENVQSLMLGWSNEILEPGTSLIKKNLKLPP